MVDHINVAEQHLFNSVIFLMKHMQLLGVAKSDLYHISHAFAVSLSSK